MSHREPARASAPGTGSGLADMVPCGRGVRRKPEAPPASKCRWGLGFPAVEPIGIEPMTSCLHSIRGAHGPEGGGSRVIPRFSNDGGAFR